MQKCLIIFDLDVPAMRLRRRGFDVQMIKIKRNGYLMGRSRKFFLTILNDRRDYFQKNKLKKMLSFG